MQITEDIILDAYGHDWKTSLVFFIRLKLHYRSGHIKDPSIRLIAERLNVSIPTVRRHFKILIKKGLIRNDYRGYTLSRMSKRNSTLSTIKFKLGMSSQDISDLLAAKIVLENLRRQNYKLRLKRSVETLNINVSMSLKLMKSIKRRKKRYNIGDTSCKDRQNRLTLKDETIAMWLGMKRHSVNAMKKRWKENGVILWMSIKECLGKISSPLASKYCKDVSIRKNGKFGTWTANGFEYRSYTQYYIGCLSRIVSVGNNKVDPSGRSSMGSI